MILLEHGPKAQPALFRAPRVVIAAHRLREVLPAIVRAEAARAAGAWVAGYIAYEAGYALEPKLAPLMPRGRKGPLVLLGLYDGPEPAGDVLARMEKAAPAVRMTPPKPRITPAAYARAMGRLLDYIAAGDCYQVNLTFPLRAQLLQGDAFGLYGALRGQGAAGHGGYVDLGQGPVVVSHSPELFFQLDAQGAILTRPMKGTRPRDADPAKDAALVADLENSAKDRAENLMIVDLLRNDIGRIARIGSVNVPALFKIEHYPTVHQMTTTVTGQLADGPSLTGLMTALFPCGSVTGAPKIRAMQIIRELESGPRGVYCGALGWMAPDGSADFSVAIRTLSVSGPEVTLNVGGGVVQDSTAAGEWEEALWKTRFVQPALRSA